MLPRLQLLNCFWLLLISGAESASSRSAAGRLAPACTPLIWLAGSALIGLLSVAMFFVRFLPFMRKLINPATSQ